MDGFHLTKAQLQEMPNPQAAFARRGAPWTFDPAALAQRLKMLREGAGKAPVAVA
jgi:pantothenate kinase